MLAGTKLFEFFLCSLLVILDSWVTGREEADREEETDVKCKRLR